MSHITIPGNFLASTTEAIGVFFGDFSGIFYLIIGLLGLAVVIEIIIGALRPK